ncbi:MAG TPA: aminoglycoside phosphotransferase family protein [Micromonosporaceae bacterium]|jgi:aminoglycoside phosphotransferase (APT) family kinase protein
MNLVLDAATARAILEPVRPEYPVTEVVRRTGGEVSTVFEIRGAGDARPLIVKVYAPQWRPKLVKEVYVYRLLARHGVRQIPRVLHASPFGIPALPMAHTVMTLLPGAPVAEFRDELTGDDLAHVYRQMGALLAAVHRIGQEQWGYLTTRVVDTRPTNTAYMSDQFARRLREFADLGGDPALASAIARRVAASTDAFAACTAPVLCHNDFHDSNVLVSPVDWRVTGFVDVEGAIAADPLFDLARTDYYALRDEPARRAAFLDGYGALPADGATRLAIYQLHHAVELWNWAAATGKSADQSRAATDIEAMLDATVEQAKPTR